MLREDADDRLPGEAEEMDLLHGVELEVFRVEQGAEIQGKTLAESDLRRETGAIVLAIRENDGFIVNPSARTKLDAGKTAVLFGTPEQIVNAGKLFRVRDTVLF